MYVAQIPNHGSSSTYLLCESYCEDGKVKTRAIGNITSLGLEKISLTAHIPKGKKLLPAEDAFKIICSRPHGHVDAILRVIRQLGLEQMILREPCRQRDLVLAMIVQRIIAPHSKLGTTREWNNTTLSE
jgi:hypothetical protein